jgi:hypothetical protein
MKFGFTADDGATVSQWIQKVTGGRFSHCLLIFSVGDSAPLYFESIAKEDPCTGKTGVRGPYPITRIREWVAESPERRRFVQLPDPGWLPLTDGEVWDAFIAAAAAVRTIGYAPLQIAQNWLAARTGIVLGDWRGSPGKWTCSEFCMRMMPARTWGAFGLPDVTADWIAPSGGRLPSVETAVGRLCPTAHRAEAQSGG